VSVAAKPRARNINTQGKERGGRRKGQEHKDRRANHKHHGEGKERRRKNKHHRQAGAAQSSSSKTPGHQANPRDSTFTVGKGGEKKGQGT
jgi:hypothetical protein